MINRLLTILYGELSAKVKFKLGQSPKGLLPIDVTESGIVMVPRDVHPENAQLPIAVTESGIVTFSRDLQLWKVHSPIDVTESGIVTLVRDLHSEKA